MLFFLFACMNLCACSNSSAGLQLQTFIIAAQKQMLSYIACKPNFVHNQNS